MKCSPIMLYNNCNKVSKKQTSFKGYNDIDISKHYSSLKKIGSFGQDIMENIIRDYNSSGKLLKETISHIEYGVYKIYKITKNVYNSDGTLKDHIVIDDVFLLNNKIIK